MASWGGWTHGTGDGTETPASLKIDPSWEGQGLPSDPSGIDCAGQEGVSVEILSTILDKQSRLETTAFLWLRVSGGGQQKMRNSICKNDKVRNWIFKVQQAYHVGY